VGGVAVMPGALVLLVVSAVLSYAGFRAHRWIDRNMDPPSGLKVAVFIVPMLVCLIAGGISAGTLGWIMSVVTGGGSGGSGDNGGGAP